MSPRRNRRHKDGPATLAQPITRDDIQSKLDEFAGEVESTTDKAKPYALAAGIGVAVVVLAVAFYLGRRAGTKKTTVVEVRRV